MPVVKGVVVEVEVISQSWENTDYYYYYYYHYCYYYELRGRCEEPSEESMRDRKIGKKRENYYYIMMESAA